MEPLLILLEVGVALHIRLVFLEARLVQIGSPLDFTVVRAALSILINLERALPGLRHVSS